jgi:hypothetical protein
MNAESLAIARYEPALSRGVQGAAFVDLVFSDGARIAVLPYVEVAAAMLLERERTPLIWPDAARDLGYDTLEALERALLPWLESRALARQSNDELVRRFSNAIDEERFGTARTARFIGAAPYAECMAAFAPYAYAARFAREAAIAIHDAAGASGAAMLATLGTVRADLGNRSLNDFAAHWFSRDIFGDAALPCDVSIATAEFETRASRVTITLDRELKDGRVVQIASPVPSDVMISFDPEDAPPVRSFSVVMKEQVSPRIVTALQDTPVSGGSSGSILMLMREGFEATPYADTDEARALADRLSAEGFSAKLASAPSVQDDVGADLVHVFGMRALNQARRHVQRLRSKGIPVVITPHISRFPEEEAWGPDVLKAIFARSADEAILQERLELLERRRLQTDVAATAQTSSLADAADVAIVTCESQAQHLRERYGFTGEVVRSTPYIRALPSAVPPISDLTGTGRFVFVHAPLEWRISLPLLVRAASRLGMPVVAAGPTVDVDMLFAARSLAPESLIHLAQPTSEELAALYGCARVYAELSWAPAGIYRVARALISGCGVVASRSSYAAAVWPEAVSEADPGSVDSLTRALQRALERPVSATSAGAAGQAFSAAIFAYATAQRARQPA